YGTMNAGKTILTSNPNMNLLMRMAGQKLCVKPHVVGAKQGVGVLLHAAADLEGHKGRDGRFYLLDFSRTFPPILPDKSIVGGHLYRLFRYAAVYIRKGKRRGKQESYGRVR